jgi:hypothetical protein
VVLSRVDSVLYCANLGDSGFLVLRQGKVVHRSKEQTHAFNTPFQLACPPPGEIGLCDRYINKLIININYQVEFQRFLKVVIVEVDM